MRRNVQEWKEAATFSGTAADLLPTVEALSRSPDWSAASAPSADECTLVLREIVDGEDIAPAAGLVAEALVAMCATRRRDEQETVWLFLFELEVARIRTGRPRFLEAALRDSQRHVSQTNTLRAWGHENDTTVVVSLLADVEDWARMFLMRTVWVGGLPPECPVCNEGLVVEWDDPWKVNERSIRPRATVSDAVARLLASVEGEARRYDGQRLAQVRQLVGDTTCYYCGSSFFTLDCFCHPQRTP
jgi:hypothetical protein